MPVKKNKFKEFRKLLNSGKKHLEELQNSSGKETVTFKIPAAGKIPRDFELDIYIHPMKCSDYIEYSRMQYKVTKDDEELSDEKVMPHYVAACIIACRDDEGNPIFDKDDAEFLDCVLNTAVVLRLSNTILTLSGLTEAAQTVKKPS